MKTTDRGYGWKHQQEKQRLNPIVEANGAVCHATICLMPTRLIPPGTRSWQWHLGHTPDRTAYTGPEHIRCNTSEGARRGNRMRTRSVRRWIL